MHRIEEAPHFGGQSPSPILLNVVSKKVTEARTTPTPTNIEETYMRGNIKVDDDDIIIFIYIRLPRWSSG